VRERKGPEVVGFKKWRSKMNSALRPRQLIDIGNHKSLPLIADERGSEKQKAHY
jgi:hypothetical protein